MGKQKIKQSKREKDKPESQGNYIDVFVKRMFGRLLVFSDFLTNYADPKFVAEIDLKRIRPAPTHYIGQRGDERIADMIFQCPLKNGRGDMMAVILFEHQHRNLKKIPLKLIRYVGSIWEAEEKAGKKFLSAPYFIILRTGKKPHRGPKPKLANLLPKGRDGKPIGKVVEIEYDLVDLPAHDFKKLVGGPVLRLTFGILKKMIEDGGENLPEAFLPLLEIPEGEQRIELTKELVEFVAKAFAANNRRFDEEMMSRALKPIFKDEERAMIKTILDEREAIGEARGVTIGVAIGKLLTILETRFKKIPKRLETEIRKMTDTVALQSWIAFAATCQSLDEFEKAIG